MIPPDTEGQETALLPEDNIMDIIYHSMPITWKNKMIEQGFNDTEPTEVKMKYSTASKKQNYQKSTKKGKSVTPTPVLLNLAKNFLFNYVNTKNTTFYTEYVVILQVSAKI